MYTVQRNLVYNKCLYLLGRINCCVQELQFIHEYAKRHIKIRIRGKKDVNPNIEIKFAFILIELDLSAKHFSTQRNNDYKSMEITFSFYFIFYFELTKAKMASVCQ